MANLIMADCIAADVPVLKRSRFANNPVQAYVTGGGDVEWSELQILSFARHIRTCQSPVIGIDDISDAREGDVERWAMTPEDWPDFYETRTDKLRATCYASLLTVPAVLEACLLAQIPPPPRWRLAWWWKNEVDSSGQTIPIPDDEDVPPPSLLELLDELERLTGIRLPANSVWACQFANYRHWDLSVIYGVRDFARR